MTLGSISGHQRHVPNVTAVLAEIKKARDPLPIERATGGQILADYKEHLEEYKRRFPDVFCLLNDDHVPIIRDVDAPPCCVHFGHFAVISGNMSMPKHHMERHDEACKEHKDVTQRPLTP